MLFYHFFSQSVKYYFIAYPHNIIVTSSPPIEVGASQPRQVWFSFDNTTVLSISELSPCVPRLCYIVLRSCIYQPHSLISDIYRRIYISVMMGPALRTIPLSYRKIFRFCIFVTTNRTGLAACKKSIHSHKPFPLFLQFVFQKCCEHSPAVIRNRFPQI